MRGRNTPGELATKSQLAGTLTLVMHQGQRDSLRWTGGAATPADGRFTRTFTFDISSQVDAASLDGNLDVQLVS